MTYDEKIKLKAFWKSKNIVRAVKFGPLPFSESGEILRFWSIIIYNSNISIVIYKRIFATLNLLNQQESIHILLIKQMIATYFNEKVTENEIWWIQSYDSSVTNYDKLCNSRFQSPFTRLPRL